jgi:hypothetical protein
VVRESRPYADRVHRTRQRRQATLLGSHSAPPHRRIACEH